MIIEWLMTLAADLFEWMFADVPEYVAPTWVADLAGAAGQVFAMADSMGVWFPAPLVLTIVLGLLTFWLVSFGIKIVRIVISHFTGGGGSAA